MENSRTYFLAILGLCLFFGVTVQAEDWATPYDAPRVERQNVFEFTQNPRVRNLGDDKHEITFTVKGYCDVTVSVVNDKGKVVRHLAAGVLGGNAPLPFQKKTLKQRLIWDGKDDLDVYVKQSEKINVRVALGLKPTFERILGWHPHDTTHWDLGGADVRGYQALVADASGVYVLLGTSPQLRRYTHKGEYVKTLLPPPADVPLKAKTGYTELLSKSGHSIVHELYSSRPGSGQYISRVFPHCVHSVVVGGKMIISKGNMHDLDTIRLNDGKVGRLRFPKAGSGFMLNGSSPEFLAASPDGSRLYFSRFQGKPGEKGKHNWGNAVYVLDLTKQEPAKIFAGVRGKTGRDNKHFQLPMGLNCDAQGRVYVCDPMNRRIQIFSAKGEFLKSIKIQGPFDIRIDQKTGVIYVLQVFMGGGATVGLAPWGAPLVCGITRLKNFADPSITASQKFNDGLIHVGGQSGPLFALDYWSQPVRLWVGTDRMNLRVFEDRKNRFEPILDFRKSVEKSRSIPFIMKGGSLKKNHGIPPEHANFITVNPTQDHAYLHSWKETAVRWDLKSGTFAQTKFPSSSFFTPRAFDAHGYLFAHVNPFITRHDPLDGMREVPFDYGTEPQRAASHTNTGGSVGVIQLKDQGYNGNKDGLGVNMRGDMAVVSIIGYIPKFEHHPSSEAAFMDHRLAESSSRRSGVSQGEKKRNAPGGRMGEAYAQAKRRLETRKKRGEKIYSVRRFPGRILAGSTIWVFDRTGELRSEDLIQGLGNAYGVEIDQTGSLYTAIAMRRMRSGKPFLEGRLQVIGLKNVEAIEYPTGTYMKTPPQGATVYSQQAPIPMSPWPGRPADLSDLLQPHKRRAGWVKGAEWLYAGAAAGGFLGPRHGLDWHKRSFIVENYRHSVGILDSNGNLIMHLGRYGNADSGRGPNSPVKV